MAIDNRVKRPDAEKIMLRVLTDCGIDEATAKAIHKKMTLQFVERLVAAIVERDGVAMRGLIVGRKNRHRHNKRGFVMRLCGGLPNYKEGGKDGFDFESRIDR